jgi:hypothetical protein
MAAQAEQALAMLAESRQADRERPTVGPEELITFVGYTFFNMVARHIATKKHS